MEPFARIIFVIVSVLACVFCVLDDLHVRSVVRSATVSVDCRGNHHARWCAGNIHQPNTRGCHSGLRNKTVCVFQIVVGITLHYYNGRATATLRKWWHSFWKPMEMAAVALHLLASLLRIFDPHDKLNSKDQSNSIST